jgi:hypothetical protein
LSLLSFPLLPCDCGVGRVGAAGVVGAEPIPELVGGITTCVAWEVAGVTGEWGRLEDEEVRGVREAEGVEAKEEGEGEAWERTEEVSRGCRWCDRPVDGA